MSTRRDLFSRILKGGGLFANPQIRDVELDGNGEFVDVQLGKRMGDPLRLDDKKVQKKLVLINFFSTRHEQQLQQMRNLAEVAKRLDKKIGRDVFINSVSLDPSHDTVERLEKLAKELDAPAGWTFVRASTHAGNELVGRMNRLRGYMRPSLVFYGSPTGYWGTFPGLNSPDELADRIARSIPGPKPKKLVRAGPARRGEEKLPWTAREV